LKVKTKELLDILNHFKLVFNEYNYISDANYIFFSTSRNIIWCYSDSLCYVFNYPSSIKNDFDISSREIAIPAKKLFDLLRKVKAEFIDMEERDKTLTIKHGRSTSLFACENITSNKDILHSKQPIMSVFEEGVLNKFKKYALYDKDHPDAENIVFNSDGIVSSNNFNFVKIATEITGEFTVRWDVVKHISDRGYEGYYHNPEENVVYFSKGNYLLTYKMNDSIFSYQYLFEEVEENLNLRYAIYCNKEESILHIDTVLSDYKKLDKKIEVVIENSNEMQVVAQGDTGAEETRIKIPLDKYLAGEAERFEIIVEYFKSVYSDYTCFYLFDNMMYCNNIAEDVERIIEIKKL